MTNIYRLALQVQDASNPNGVVNSLAKEVMPAIRDEAGYREQGTAYISSHPAFILFVDKLAAMAHVQGLTTPTMDVYSGAYEACIMRANDLEAAEIELAAGLREAGR